MLAPALLFDVVLFLRLRRRYGKFMNFKHMSGAQMGFPKTRPGAEFRRLF
jgi:hypothetical protein